MIVNKETLLLSLRQCVAVTGDCVSITVSWCRKTTYCMHVFQADLITILAGPPSSRASEDSLRESLAGLLLIICVYNTNKDSLLLLLILVIPTDLHRPGSSPHSTGHRQGEVFGG